MRDRIDSYFNTLDRVTRNAQCTDAKGNTISLGEAFEQVRDETHAAHDRGNKLMFIGNGGSAGICSHMATDFSKNGGLRATAFNDGSVLTCLGNDLGYDQVFAKQIEWHGRKGDVLIAISSSGKSPNILNAVNQAGAVGCSTVTFSGFRADNPLRQRGQVNFYIDSLEYGFVEVAHQALIHAILDLDLGWGLKPEHNHTNR